MGIFPELAAELVAQPGDLLSLCWPASAVRLDQPRADVRLTAPPGSPGSLGRRRIHRILVGSSWSGGWFASGFERDSRRPSERRGVGRERVIAAYVVAEVRVADLRRALNDRGAPRSTPSIPMDTPVRTAHQPASGCLDSGSSIGMLERPCSSCWRTAGGSAMRTHPIGVWPTVSFPFRGGHDRRAGTNTVCLRDVTGCPMARM